MGLFRSTPEERAAKEQQAAEARAQKERRAEEERRRIEAEAFAKTPAGQARRARAAKRRIFQTDMVLSETTGSTFADFSSHSRTSETLDCGGMIEAIEEEGWRLEHADYIYRVTGSSSRDRHLSSGQKETVSGQIVGIYIFRAAEV